MIRCLRVLVLFVFAGIVVFSSPRATSQSAFIQPAAVVTHHNNNARTGVNPNEQILTPENVSSDQFQLLYQLPVDGQVYAQPLFVPNVQGADGAKHNYLIIATEMNKLYIWDVASVEAQVRGGGTPTPALFFNLAPPLPYNFMPMAYTSPDCFPAYTCPDVPATATEADPTTGMPYNLWPSIGVTSTPVVDTTTMRLYVVAKSGRGPFHVLYLSCFELTLLRPCAVPSVEITGAVGSVVFNSKMQLQRAALLLANGMVYVGFGSHQDTPPYHGWILAYNATTLAQEFVWVSTPDTRGGSVWQAGGGPAADENGNLYVMTGNADGPMGDPATNFANSFVKLRPDLTVADSYRVGDQYANDYDVDLGASGPVLLDTNSLVGGGKEGILYNFDRNNLSSPRQAFQASMPCPNLSKKGSAWCHHIHGVPVVWRNLLGKLRLYVWPERDRLKAFTWDDNSAQFQMGPMPLGAALLGPTAPGFFPFCPYSLYGDPAVPHEPPSCRQENPGDTGINMPGGALSLSADGNKHGTAILWASINRDADALKAVVPGVLWAFDAGTLGELWNSDQNQSRDAVGNFAKYTPPTVTYGSVFLATFSDRVNVYGLRQGAKFIDQDDPRFWHAESLLPGQRFTTWVMFTNTGFTTWRRADGYALGSQTTWGITRVPLPFDVAPYQDVLIPITGIAPSKPGVYDFQWKMIQDGVGWFGDATRTVRLCVVTCGVMFSVFEDGYASQAGPSDAVYILSQSDGLKACLPSSLPGPGICRKWFGRSFSVSSSEPVYFFVFDDGYANQAGPSDAVYILSQSDGMKACIPDGTATGTCRKWFGRGFTRDGRPVLLDVFDDGYTNQAGPSDAVYILSQSDGMKACIPDGTATGTCRKWFGRGQATGRFIGLDPTQIGIGQVPVCGSDSAPLMISNLGTANLTIQSVSVSPAPGPFSVNFSSSTVLTPGDRMALGVTFKPTVTGGATGQLNISSDDPTRPNLSIPLTAEGVIKPPTIIVVPPTLKFGAVAGTKSFAIWNAGSSALAITGVTPPTDPAFSIVAKPDTIPCFEPGLLTVSFAPDDVAHTATIIVTSSDPQHPSVTLGLRGGESSGGTDSCAALDDELAALQQDLEGARGPAKAAILRQIEEVLKEKKRLNCL